MIDFRTPTYLDSGTPRQRQASEALRRLGIFDRLAAFTPVLAGTIPLDIDHPGSDLDVLCCAADLDAFAGQVTGWYGSLPGFALRRKTIRGAASCIARVDGGEFPVELFAQAAPVTEQYGYRHMVIEYRLLEAGGAPVKQAIRQLKQAGMKTEPAFAGYFGLVGDPYQALLELEALDDAALEQLARRRRICGLCEN